MRNILIISICFVSLLLIVFGLYYPGLSGPFIFDDIPNLQPLGRWGGVQDWPSALYFTFSGAAGPLGRPLSLLSFLVNDHTWPADPFAFKYTNVLLHLLNGVLVFVLGRMLCANFIPANKQKSDVLALIATAIWLVHPIQVSATLFVVQRMTLLSSLFILLTLIGYLYYRAQNYKASNVIYGSLLISVCITLGALSKENAVMAIFYIAVLESLLFQKKEGLWRYFYWLVLVGCVAIVFALFNAAISADIPWTRRGFTLIQRCLTELRVLWSYVGAILLPRPSDFSLFNDDYLVSSGLVKPITTLYSMLAWAAVAIVGIVLRKKFPLLIFALSWYLAGHLMESTVLPLEIYYDHRNYLPMLGICWLLAFVMLELPIRTWLKAAALMLVLLMLSFILSANVKVWTSEDMMAEIWSAEHPNSPRAQQTLIRKAVSLGDGKKSKQLIDQIAALHPNNAHLALQQIIISCFIKEEIDTEYYRKLLKGAAPHQNGVVEALGQLQGLVLQSDGCPGLDLADVETFHKAILANNYYDDAFTHAIIYQQLAAMAVAKKDLDLAIEYMDKAYESNPSNIEYPLIEANWLAGAGLFDDAEHYLGIAKATVPRRYFQRFQYRALLLLMEARIANIKKRHAEL